MRRSFARCRVDGGPTITRNPGRDDDNGDAAEDPTYTVWVGCSFDDGSPDRLCPSRFHDIQGGATRTHGGFGGCHASLGVTGARGRSGAVTFTVTPLSAGRDRPAVAAAARVFPGNRHAFANPPRRQPATRLRPPADALPTGLAGAPLLASFASDPLAAMETGERVEATQPQRDRAAAPGL